jgi:hypothetical protein
MAKTKKNKRMGRPPKHGGFSIVYKDDQLKKNPKIRQYLQDCRGGLVKDIAGTEDNLTEQQRIMIDRIISKLSIVRLIEAYVEANGAFDGDSLKDCLGRSYIAFTNSIDRALSALGIDKKYSEEPLSLDEYIRENYSDDDGDANQGEKVEE